MQPTPSSPARAQPALLRWGLVALALLPVAYYVGMVGWYAYDFPYMDDYPAVVDFLVALPTAPDKLRLLLEQNNFHRVVWVKALAWLNVALTGTISFTFLQYVGCAGLLLTAGLLWQASNAGLNPGAMKTLSVAPGFSPVGSFPAVSPALLIFLPVLYLLFQFQSWNVAFWGMVAVSNAWAPAWALLAFYLAFRARPGWAVAVGVAALFTNGNGILVLPLLLAGFGLRSQWRPVFALLAVSLPAFWLYFTDYRNPSGGALATLLQPGRLGHLLALDTAFLGALFYHPAVAWLSQLVGGLTVGWAFYLLVTRYDRRNPTLFWFLVFLHGTGLLLAVNRIENSVDIMYASRYRNITALVLATTYLTLADVVGKRSMPGQRWFVGLALAGAVAINIVSNWTYRAKIGRFRELKQTDHLFWQRYGQVRASAPQYRPVAQLNALARAGTFRPGSIEPAELSSRPVAVRVPTQSAERVTYDLDLQRVDGPSLIVSGWAKLAGRKANFNDTYLGVKTRSGWQFYTTLFHQRLDNEDAVNDKDTGFTAIIPRADLPPNPTLGLFVRSGGQTGFVSLPALDPAP